MGNIGFHLPDLTGNTLKNERERQDVLNRGSFSYDAASDPLYRQYAEQYVRLGRRAMEDTAANAAAQTGGYGNSYARTAAQQSYNGYLEKLNDRYGELLNLARERYGEDMDEKRRDLDTLVKLDETEYGRRRDALEDYYRDAEKARKEASDADGMLEFLLKYYADNPDLTPGYGGEKKKSKGNAVGTATERNVTMLLESMTPAQRKALYEGSGEENAKMLKEIRAALGDGGLRTLKEKYPGA